MFHRRRHNCCMGVCNRISDNLFAPFPTVFPAAFECLETIARANMAFAKTNLAIVARDLDDKGIEMVKCFLRDFIGRDQRNLRVRKRDIINFQCIPLPVLELCL